MRLYDTLSGLELEVGDSAKTRIYLCGVTVYDESHIGHARTIIVFDVLRRHLEQNGTRTELIQNFTDVDDKIITRAHSEGVSAEEISTRYIKNYFDDFDGLNVRRATVYPMATKHIPDIIQIIEKLIDRGFAYSSKNGVYFAVSKFPEYGKLSKKKTDELQAGARIGVDEAKNDPLDFAVWKFSEEEPVWDSPWGKGRPGWHIECSAMSARYLGANFDIHGGGRDLIFPHHENEIAQSESCMSASLAKIWMHVGMVTINGDKMSKSLGNIQTIRDALERWGANTTRLFCLSGHYSKPIDYSEESLRENLIRWRQAESCYFELIQAGNKGGHDMDGQISSDFDCALDGDLNTHLALTAFFRLVQEVNKMAAEGTLDQANSESIMAEFQRMMDVLGLNIPVVTQSEKDEIISLMARRATLRSERKFEDADRIRNQISKMGVEIVDHGKRTVWIKRESVGAKD